MAMLVAERFVNKPGSVLICYKVDDPNAIVKPPEDLFEAQVKGLPETLGKKDKFTTEQAFFRCVACKCELKSLKTLRDHCKGSTHIRNEILLPSPASANQERRRSSAARASSSPDSSPSHRRRRDSRPDRSRPRRRRRRSSSSYSGEDGAQSRRRRRRRQHSSSNHKSLSSLLDRCSGPIVGLPDVKEFLCAGRSPLYACTACRTGASAYWPHCFVGNAESLLDHLVGADHARTYFERRYSHARGMTPSVPSELLREAANEERAIGRQLGKVGSQTVTVAEYARYFTASVKGGGSLWRRAYLRESAVPEHRSRAEDTPDENPECIPNLPLHLQPMRPYTVDPDIIDINADDDDDQMEDNVKTTDVKDGEHASDAAAAAGLLQATPSKIQLPPNPSMQSESKASTARESKFPPHPPVKAESKPDVKDVKPVLPKPSEDLSFLVVKGPDSDAELRPPSPTAAKKAVIKQLYISVTEFVKRCLNGYFYGKGGYPKKIEARDEYTELARRFSHNFRNQEKAAFVAAGGKIEDLKFNAAMEERIKAAIDAHMEGQPLVQE